MDKASRLAWREKNKRLNENVTLKRGMRVTDENGFTGVIVQIVLPESDDNPIEDHGMVAVWLENQMNYGDNNCEHYTYVDWQTRLRILD